MIARAEAKGVDVVPAMDSGAIPFADVLRFWLKLGLISFGGPAGQISVMHQELVERRRWISERRFLHALNYTMLLPGPEAQQLATYTGWLFHGIKGGIVAGLLFVLPSFLILCVLAWVYLSYGQVSWVQAVLHGVKPAVTAIVLFAAYRIGRRTLKNPMHWVIAATAFVAIAVFNVPFPFIVFAAGIAGLAGGYLRPDRLSNFKADDATPAPAARACVVDDHTPTPQHACFRWRRTVSVFCVGVGIWLSAFGLLMSVYGWDATLTQMGWFFTKAALVTFGGAYAVLPYVHQGAVETYGWLSTSQMIDGLALGETTPGPLIMVVTFVGFVGGWTKTIFGPESLLLAGFIAAAVTTVFTFLPSFLLILIGGPLVEATRGDKKFTAPLAAITAAVVGVILNLAVFFAHHILWPQGLDGPFDGIAAVFGVCAFIGLTRFRIGVIPTVGLAAMAGLFYELLATAG